MAVSEPINSAETQHQIYLQRLFAHTGNKVNPVLESFGKWARKEILGQGTHITTKKQLNALLKDVNKRFSGDLDKWVDELNKDLFDLAEYEPNFQTGLINKGIETANFNSEVPATAQVVSAARNNPLLIGTNGGAVDFDSMIKDFTPTQVSKAAGIISSGFFQGQTTAQISSNLLNNGLAATQRSAMMLSKTTMNHMAIQAKEQTYKANDDVIIGYVIIATLDSSTSDICKGWDQTEVKFTDTFQPKPPFHPNCRSSTAPLFNGQFAIDDDSAKRASVGSNGGEQVSGKLSYYSWLKTQPAEFQDEALGKTRGLIFRNAGLTTEEFRKASRNRMGESLTLDEMAKKDERINAYLSK